MIAYRSGQHPCIEKILQPCQKPPGRLHIGTAALQGRPRISELFLCDVQSPDKIQTFFHGLARPVARGDQQAQSPPPGLCLMTKAQQGHLGMEQAERPGPARVEEEMGDTGDIMDDRIAGIEHHGQKYPACACPLRSHQTGETRSGLIEEKGIRRIAAKPAEVPGITVRCIKMSGQ
ncbi:MAG: hypothetical protein SPI23_00060 [Desulfovibrio sp.]|uniref:hypothetical protein n=1 Tax=Desulfovibrio sp. TaxID=885 RepID=UPI002A90D11C|nr:hypothetical protein [Desulfovibrio sp.]MDY6233062.1 hypothetical protein [Desulfovibrio sp.]